MFLFCHFSWAVLQQLCPKVFSLQDYSKVAVAQKETHADFYVHCLDEKVYGASFTPLTLGEHNIAGVTAFTRQEEGSHTMENYVLLLHYLANTQTNHVRNFVTLLANVSVDDLQDNNKETRIKQHLDVLMTTFDQADQIKENTSYTAPEFFGAVRLWQSKKEIAVEPAPESVSVPKKSFWKTQKQWVYTLGKSGIRVATWIIPYNKKKTAKRITDRDKGLVSPKKDEAVNPVSPSVAISESTVLSEDIVPSESTPIVIKKIGNTDIYIHKTTQELVVLGCSIDENAVRQYINALLLFLDADLSTSGKKGMKMGTHQIQGYGQTHDDKNWLLIQHENNKHIFLTLLPHYQPQHMGLKESEDRLIELLDYFSQTIQMVQTHKKNDEQLRELEGVLHTKNGACVMLPSCIKSYWGQSWVDWWYGTASPNKVEKIGETGIYYQDIYPLKITWSKIDNDPPIEFLDYLVDDQTGSEPCATSFDYCQNPIKCKWIKTVKNNTQENKGVLLRFDTLDDFFLIFLHGQTIDNIKTPGLQPIQTIGCASYIAKSIKVLQQKKMSLQDISFPVDMPMMPGACGFVKRSKTVKTIEGWVNYYRTPTSVPQTD